MQANFFKHQLKFIVPGGTSRGVLNNKTSYFIKFKTKTKSVFGEVSIIPNLSIDSDEIRLEEKLKELCKKINHQQEIPLSFFHQFPALEFGYEMALKNLHAEHENVLYPSVFTEGKIGQKINGLIWMGSEEFMLKQISEKLDEGFKCLKLKVGNLNFNSEMEILKSIRKNFNENILEIRLDANGAFSPSDATEKLKKLSDFHIHSIEQPIKPKQWFELAEICSTSPIDVALDEELIGISHEQGENMLTTIQPKYIILKPSLIGGFSSTDHWIKLAEKLNIDWWITSALESNIGLSAIAQYTFTKNNLLPQGLGTGKLYSNNIKSPLQIKGEYLWYDPKIKWDFSILNEH